jgi:hypothetical protein
MKLQDHLPVDHKLGQVYRYSAGAIGLFLIVFGILGFTNNVGFFSTTGAHVAGMTTNGALSLLSVLFGALLVGGAVVGGNTASTLNIGVGILFIISGFVNLGLIAGPDNLLNFHMRNVIFSFAVGLGLLLFGMYGRVTLHLPHDNPYWRSRHPDAAQGNPLPPRALPHG